MKLRARLILIVAGVLVIAFLVSRWRHAHLESSQDKNVLAAAQKHRVDPALVKAVVWRESKFDPRARGTKGEIGLMQIRPDTGAGMGGRATGRFVLRVDAAGRREEH